MLRFWAEDILPASSAPNADAARGAAGASNNAAQKRLCALYRPALLTAQYLAACIATTDDAPPLPPIPRRSISALLRFLCGALEEDTLHGSTVDAAARCIVRTALARTPKVERLPTVQIAPAPLHCFCDLLDALWVDPAPFSHSGELHETGQVLLDFLIALVQDCATARRRARLRCA